MYKLGSLFDGSGGFPLAGSLCGIEPKWAAEVEPYPIAVTRTRFPSMRHLGDISKVNGAEIEPVDIITFGSPCQDLSVAGKRAGLKHEANGDEETTRSGLFMEAVRIIKEMREATDGIYPRFALWENVPGAFSSNKGEDFRIVCEELIKIVEPSAVMPEVPQRGWAYSDSYIGDGWSLAYRTFDAQYWGVPQRRRRIHLVADFRGERAREVLFEREGVRGYFAEGRTPWQSIAADAEGRTGADDREGEGFDGYNGDLTGVVSSTLGVNCGVSTGRNGVIERRLDAVAFAQNQRDEVRDLQGKAGALMAEPGMKQQTFVAYSFDSLASNSMKSSNPHSGCREVEVAKCLDTTDPNPSKNQGGIAIVEPIPYTLKIRSGCEGGGKGALVQEDKSATLATNNDQYLFQPVPNLLLDDQGGQQVTVRTDDKSPTLRAEAHGNVPAVVFGIENHPADSRVNVDESGKVQTLTSRMGTGGGNVPMVMEQKPVICLQGNGIDRADTAGCNGKGWKEDTCYTLNTIDRPAVAYGLDRASFNQGQNAKFDFSITEGQQPCLTARGPGAVCCTTGSFMQATEEVSPTLMARDWKDPTVVCSNYIVRRLTPTECARLQGFADRWGDIAEKKTFTDEEFRFWHEVRNTHAAINGKKVQDYTEKQMLTWYNKLHTDSAEYKMWGNGIALPPALYCMQGIVDALNTPEEEDDAWML